MPPPVTKKAGNIIANEGVGRGATIGAAIIVAGVTAMVTLGIARMLDAPAELSALDGRITSIQALVEAMISNVNDIADLQANVRERLQETELAVRLAGSDRYRGVQAEAADRYFSFRINSLEKRIDRLEMLFPRRKKHEGQ